MLASKVRPKHCKELKVKRGESTALRGIACVAMLAVLAACASNDLRDTGKEPSAFLISMDDVEWKPWESPLKVPGSTIAVLKGDFDKQGQLVFLNYMPAHFRIPAHWHDTDEDIVVVAGSLYMGGADGRPMGQANGMLFRNGDRHLNSAKTVHWLVTTNEPAIIKIRTSGPFRTHWLEN
jgi:hypothetical protein